MKSLLVFAAALCLSAHLFGQATDDAPPKLYARLWATVGGATLPKYSGYPTFYFKAHPGIAAGVSVGGKDWGLGMSCFSQAFKVDLQKTNQVNAPAGPISLTNENFDKVETNGVMIGPYLSNGLRKKGLHFEFSPSAGAMSMYFPAYRVDNLFKESTRTLQLAYCGTLQVRYLVYKGLSVGISYSRFLSRFPNDDLLDLTSIGMGLSVAGAM